MLNIISNVASISFIIIDIHTIVNLHIVSRIYGSYTRNYLLMRKQCLMYMLLLAASEHAEKNPLVIKFSKRCCRVVQTYCLGRAPTNFHVAERSHLFNNDLFFTSHAPVRSGCVHLSRDNLRWNKNLVLSNELIKVKLPPWKIWKADVSSVSPSSERIEELWVVVVYMRV